jgi:hypothetical protein
MYGLKITPLQQKYTFNDYRLNYETCKSHSTIQSIFS